MRIEQLMSTEVAFCRQGDNLHTAASKMWERDVGSIPVCDVDDIVVGVITDRDACMAAYTRDQKLRDISVASVLSEDPITCGPLDSVTEVERLMSENQIRRVPVVDDTGRLIGMVSLNDIARATAAQIGRPSSDVPTDDFARTVAAICRPHTPVHLSQGTP